MPQQCSLKITRRNSSNVRQTELLKDEMPVSVSLAAAGRAGGSCSIPLISLRSISFTEPLRVSAHTGNNQRKKGRHGEAVFHPYHRLSITVRWWSPFHCCNRGSHPGCRR